MTVYKLDSIIALNNFNDFLDYQVCTSRIEELSLQNAARCVAMRVKYLVVFVIAQAATLLACVEMGILAYRLRTIDNVAFRDILKVELVFIKAVLLAQAQVALNIICPELMMTETFDLRVPLATSIAQVMAGSVATIDMFYSVAEIDKELLPDGGNKLTDYHSELFALLQEKEKLHFGCFKLYCREVLAYHYSEVDISLASNKNRNDPLVYAAIKADLPRIEQYVREGKDLSPNACEGECVADIVAYKFGQNELQRLLSMHLLEKETTYTLLKNFLSQNQMALVIELIERVERLQPAQQPIWWKTPRNRAELFVLAGTLKNKAIAQKFISGMAFNEQFPEYQNKNSFMVAVENGWDDFFTQMIAVGVDFSREDANGETAYEYLEGRVGISEAVSNAISRDSHFSELIKQLMRRAKYKEAGFLIADYMEDPSLLSWKNRETITTLYIATIEIGQGEFRKKLLPYVDFTAVRDVRIFNKKPAWEIVAALNSTIFEEDLRRLNIRNCLQVVPLITSMLLKRNRYAEPLLQQVLTFTNAEPSKAAGYKKLFSALFMALAITNKIDYAKAFISFIDVAYEDPITQKTALMYAAERGWVEEVISLVQRGSLLHAVDNKGIPALDYMSHNLPVDVLEKIARVCSKEQMTIRNKQGTTLLSLLADKELFCGCFTPQIRAALISYGISTEVCKSRVKMAAVRAFVNSPEYARNSALAQAQKEEAVSLFQVKQVVQNKIAATTASASTFVTNLLGKGV